MSRKRQFYAALRGCPRHLVERLEEMVTAEGVADALATPEPAAQPRRQRVWLVLDPDGAWRRLWL
jgi:hypothetical protein